MSKKPSAPDKTPARPLNRLGIGTLSVLQILLLATALIALNYLAAHHFHRLDLSRDNDYTLSSSTQRYLVSDALSKREKPIGVSIPCISKVRQR